MSTEQRPLDLAAVQADDALLDELGGPGRIPGQDELVQALGDGPDDELAQLLTAWRQDACTGPGWELAGTGQALAAIRAGNRRLRRRLLAGYLAAAAAAALLAAFSAAAVASWPAQPGDWLYPVRELIYGHEVP